MKSRHFSFPAMLLCVLVMAMSFSLLHQYDADEHLLANLTVSQLRFKNHKAADTSDSLPFFLQKKNVSPFTVLVEHEGEEERETIEVRTSLHLMGFNYTAPGRPQPWLNAEQLHGAAGDNDPVQISVSPKRWRSFLRRLNLEIQRPGMKSELVWSEGDGWSIRPDKPRIELDRVQAAEVYQHLTQTLRENQYLDDLLIFKSREKSETKPRAAFQQKKQLEHIQKLVSQPLVVDMGDEEMVFDLSSQREFIELGKNAAQISRKGIKAWVKGLKDQVYRPSNTVRIVGREEIRPGVYHAVTEGNFEEGRRLNVDAMVDAIVTAYEEGEQAIRAPIDELPLRVYSELDGMEYDLLSVGYSDYSTGNKPNRVHNIKTGLGRINTTLIDPEAKISFNRFVGPFNSDFVEGYGIFGKVAKPVLGGGICQVSTTFYRALLALGVPITMRQNHSWDLSYYREGGYGLDATIFPSEGLDVKAVNDYEHPLFIYSYTRPKDETAFVLVYGVNDGREVELKPAREYKPYYGAKTLRWKQTVRSADGEVREHNIISRYRM